MDSLDDNSSSLLSNSHLILASIVLLSAFIYTLTNYTLMLMLQSTYVAFFRISPKNICKLSVLEQHLAFPNKIALVYLALLCKIIYALDNLR